MVFTISADEISIVYRFLMSNPYCALEERRWLKSKKHQGEHRENIVEVTITVNRFGMQPKYEYPCFHKEDDYV